ncbi:MAG TPA: isoprenylcysteine carboxylmethyltransferase family protein [Candidatus Wallbacteria bacterium]|nr:isoprenylcysteine carboxylmethyltransferase family protein [Candidatus Wallbacteria bacterium]
MPDLTGKYYALTIFAVLGCVKGFVEAFAARSRGRGGEESSKAVSKLFILAGILTPVFIPAEIIFFERPVSLSFSLLFSAVFFVLMYARILAIKALGSFYSVDIRIADAHRLVKTGPYRYFRHPIYLIGLIESFVYPLAPGAFLTAAVSAAVSFPLILFRRAEEEKALLEKFGAEYEIYKKSTWF